MDKAIKIDKTKDCILSLIEASGPQTIEAIVREVKLNGYLGCMAYALSGLQYDFSIEWNSEDQVYELWD